MREERNPMESCSLYSERALELLRKAQKEVEEEKASEMLRYCYKRINSAVEEVSSEGEQIQNLSSSSSSESEREESQQREETTIPENEVLSNSDGIPSTDMPRHKKKKKKVKTMTERQREQFVKSLGTPSYAELPTGETNLVVEVASALLTKHERQSDMATICKAYTTLAT